MTTTTELPRWVSSSYSNNGGQCIEWAPEFAVTGTVPVRDSKDTTGPTLAFSADAWSAFVGMTKRATV